MKPVFAILLVSSLAMGCRSTRQPVDSAKPLEGWEVYAWGTIEVTCEPAYYVRTQDRCLVPADEAAGDFQASGILLKVVQPEHLARSVVAFHFDLPEPWNRWYKPGILYRGRVSTNHIGRLAFMCDSGWPAVSTNAVLRTPNPQGGANGRQPSGSETNRTSGAAAPRRSP